MLANTACRFVQFRASVRSKGQRLACCANGLCVGRLAHRTKPPGIDQSTHAGMECTCTQALHLQRALQHLQNFRRERHPFVHRRTVQAHQVAVWFPGRHLCIHLLHRSSKVLPQDRQLNSWARVDTDRPASAHRRAMQCHALATDCRFRRHLRHSAPRLLAWQRSIPVVAVPHPVPRRLLGPWRGCRTHARWRLG